MKRADQVREHLAGSHHNHPLTSKGHVMAVVDSTGAQRAPKRPNRALNIQEEVAVMQQMTVGQLRERYVDLFGEPTFSRHKKHLIRKIAWRMGFTFVAPTANIRLRS